MLKEELALTVRIIKLKKLKVGPLASWVVLTAFFGAWSAFAGSQAMPNLRNVGVVPVQWEGDFSILRSSNVDFLTSEFSKVVRESERFSVINDELIESLWSKPNGRSELESQYELHAFLSLSVYLKSDVIEFTVRLMSPSLDVYLSERESVASSWFINTEEADLKKRIEGLVFRTLNRLPIDMTVTSIQGRFITLSAGSLQNVKLNDQIVLLRPYVSAVHPADGTWLKFENQKIGEAKVIDVKKRTSIARLVSLSHEDAAKIGDGVKVDRIANRARFARLSEKQEFVDTKDPVILSPMYNGNPIDQPEKQTQSPIPNMRNEKNDASPVATENPFIPPSEKVEEPDERLTINFLQSFKETFEEINFEAGPRIWSIAGDSSASSKMPLWVLNHFGVGARMKMLGSIDFDTGAFFDIGQTTNSSILGYTGFGAFIRSVYSARLSSEQRYRLGGEAQFESRSILDESYGGGDLLVLTLFGGLGGRSDLNGSQVDWNADILLHLFGVGQVGMKGSKSLASGVSGFGMRAEGFLVKMPQAMEYGAGLLYDSQSITSESGSISQSDTQILLKARYRF